MAVRHLWAHHSIVFIFLRHFACIGCRAHAVQVWQDRERYEGGGAKIVFVGNGSPDFIERFREDLKLGEALIFTDPSLEVFKAAGFKHGFFAVVQPSSVLNVVKLAREGHRQVAHSPEAGTHWQLGGVIAISKAGKLLYHFISESVGDHAPNPDIEVIARMMSDKNGS